VTPKARLNFAYLFTPRGGPNGEDPKFRCCLVFEPPTDITALRRVAGIAAREKWGQKMPPKLKSPFRDCSDREGQPGFPPGGIFINATSKTRPGVCDQRRNKILSNEQIYSGCYVRASLRAYAYDTNGNRGVSFALLNVQKWSDGERLDNVRAPEDDFDALPGGDDEGPFAGQGNPLDDDIPF
jgi:hypothetical protein